MSVTDPLEATFFAAHDALFRLSIDPTRSPDDRQRAREAMDALTRELNVMSLNRLRSRTPALTTLLTSLRQLHDSLSRGGAPAEVLAALRAFIERTGDAIEGGPTRTSRNETPGEAS